MKRTSLSPTVLVVHPDADERQAFLDLFSDLGFEPIFANDQAQALLLLRNLHPQIIFCACDLPDGSGIDLCRIMRATTSLPFGYFALLTRTPDDQARLPDAFTAGVDDILLLPINRMSLRGRLQCANRMLALESGLRRHVRVVARLNLRLKVMNQRLAIQATRDGLTGLLNRREADECLRRQISRARRTKDLLSCAIIDIDGFKHVNDTAGHVAGDAVIRHVAHTLLGVMRDEDHIFRIGGDEFLVVFPCTGTEGTALAMERLRQTVEQTAIEIEGWKIQVKVTVGVAGLTSGVGNHEDFLREADLALYAAKQAGRNRVLIQAA